MVLKNENRFIRLESTAPIAIPLLLEALYHTHSDMVSLHCEIFRVYDSVNNRLAFLKLENETPLVVEVAK